jgi:hypothetical protein
MQNAKCNMQNRTARLSHFALIMGRQSIIERLLDRTARLLHVAFCIDHGSPADN